jgi:pilus assembly protein FimV
MGFNYRLSATAVFAAASLALSPAAWSLGLGDATVDSYLNQPLQARIDLISQASDDLESVSARLASAEDYELIGASREAVSVPIRFTIEDIDGDAYILATSTLPIIDPVLRLIVEVNWASGRMLREYTLFLDPPTVPAAAPALPRIDQRKPSPARVTEPPPPEVPAAEPPAPAEAPAAAPAALPSPAPAVSASAGQEYGPVQSGDTLWEIASGWSGRQGRGINRVMIAIQRENPNAFLNGNINLLKRGAILRMPAPGDIENISSSTANREVVTQQEQFQARRTAATAASPATPLLIDESAAPPAPAEPPAEVTREAPADRADSESTAVAELDPGTDEAAAEQPVDAAAEVAEQARDQLELVPPSAGDLLESVDVPGQVAGDEAAAPAQQLRESLARTEEELINQRQQNEYLEERIRELESRLQEAEAKAVEDADLANMEDRLRVQREAAAADGAEPWYSRPLTWLVVVLALAAGLLVWWFSRRGRAAVFESAPVDTADSLQEIRGEAEEVLRTLDEEPSVEPAEQETPEAEPAADSGDTVVRFPAGEGDAELLDEESSDPEIQLDLARAYISMGDKEAARIILEEVISNGSEEQQAEARKMLDVLASP